MSSSPAVELHKVATMKDVLRSPTSGESLGSAGSLSQQELSDILFASVRDRSKPQTPLQVDNKAGANSRSFVAGKSEHQPAKADKSQPWKSLQLGKLNLSKVARVKEESNSYLCGQQKQLQRRE